MPLRQPYRYVMVLCKRDGSPLAQVPVAADWEPALEAARFQTLRRFPDAAIGADADADFRPVWHQERGQPYFSAVDVAVSSPDIGEVICRVPTSYFKSYASEASPPLVKQGLLQAGEHFTYLMTAFPTPPKGSASRPLKGFEIEEVAAPLAVKSSSLADFTTRSIFAGDQNGADIHVFVRQNVIAEVEELTRNAREVEAAAVLIGHLHRDISSRDIFLEVTAQIPAINSQATSTQVSFGPETWDAVHAALTLRRQSEQWVGWFHSHPALHWCNPNCTPESRARCPLQRSFFSADDCDVQRTVFAKAFHIALLITNTDAGLQHAMFTWRNGVIAQRGFQILIDKKNEPVAASIATATIGDSENEKTCS